MSFLITYFSAFDRGLIRELGSTKHSLQPVTETLIAPSAWSAQQVSDAFLRQHPGIELIACTPQP